MSTHWWQVNGDTGNGSFNILGTSLRFTASADYEMRVSYSIRINVSDGTNDFAKPFIITVTDVNDNAPVFTSGATINVAEGVTTVTTVTAIDADVEQTVTFLTTLSGADAGLFSIIPAGVLRFKTAPDFETPRSATGSNVYTVIVTATDGQPSPMISTQTLIITVTDVNENNDHAPVFTSGTTVDVAENTRAVTTVTATDADLGQTVTFTLTGGVDESKFSITSAGVLTFNTAPDYENPTTDTGGDNEYEVIVTATDGHPSPLTAMQTLTITVVAEVLGLEAFTEIAVYPNPAGAVLHISGMSAGNARYTLSGLEGKVVKRGKLEVAGKGDHSVAIPSLKKGIYLLQITTGKDSITRKIVKE